MPKKIDELFAAQSQQEKLLSLGTLVAGIAHEMNNPLTYCVTNLDLMLEELEELRVGRPPKQAAIDHLRTLIEDAKDGAKRVLTIVRDLKAFSRLDDREQSEWVDVGEVIAMATRMSGNEIRSKAKIMLEVEPNLPRVRANRNRLCQVILNIVINAYQAMSEGDAARNYIRIRAIRSEKDRIAITIQDSGAGMPPEVLSRIFDPFFTTKPIGAGTGLGLSICHGIVTAIGGEIYAESEPKRGSKFTIMIPVAAMDARQWVSATQDPEKRRRSERARVDTRPSVLVVDDEVALCQAIGKVLQRSNSVRVCSDSKTALELLMDHTFDVVVCDLSMPGLTGMELFHAVCEKRPELAPRFIFITGGAVSPEARAFIESTKYQILPKPFETTAIREAVRKLAEASRREAIEQV